MCGVTEGGNKKVFVITTMGMRVYLSLLVFNLDDKGCLGYFPPPTKKKLKPGQCLDNYSANKIFTIPGHHRVEPFLIN